MTATDHLSKVQFSHYEPSEGYHQVTATEGSNTVGWLRWHDPAHENKQYGPGEITALGVSAEYQHQGIATAMYHKADDIAGPVVSSPVRTKAGEGWGVKAGVPRVPLRDKGYLADMAPPPVTRSRDQER